MGVRSRIRPNPNFPAREVERCIRGLLANRAGAQDMLRLRPTSACEPEVDSPVVVEVICATEEAAGVILPSTSVPCGGCQDVEARAADLMSNTRFVWSDPVKEEEHRE